MNQRERIIRLWFDMWLQQKDLGIDDIFTEDVIYIESWSPKYENRIIVKHCNPTADQIVCGSMTISNNSLKQTSAVLAQFISSFQYNSCTRFVIYSFINMTPL